MEFSIVFCSGKKVACVGTEVVSSVPVSEFIRSSGGSKQVFSEPDKLGKVNSNPLTYNPNAFE